MNIKDRRGIEGFPLQLLIIFIVIAIVIPLTWNYLTIYSEQQTQDSIEIQLEGLEAAVREVYSMGPGNSRVVELNIKGSLACDIDYVRIGGTPSNVWSDLSSFRYKLQDSPEQYFMITDPNIAMFNSTGQVEFGAGARIVEVRSLDEYIIQKDIDGDGFWYSRVVEIGVIY